MSTLDNIKIREWKNQHWVDPSEYLRKIRKLEYSIALSDLDLKVKSLRTNLLSEALERRQAALFGMGLKVYLENETVQFCHFENSDYDVVYRRRLKDTFYYTAVQLKEIVPKRINENSSLKTGLEKLKKYSTSDDLHIAIHCNHEGSLDIREVKIPESLNFSGIYLYGACSRDQKEWFVSGNLMREEKELFLFKYPDSV